jgi:hypothetical protein
VKGHRAASYRNARRCFTCDKLEYFTNRCLSRSSRQSSPLHLVVSSSSSKLASSQISLPVAYSSIPPLNSILKPKITSFPFFSPISSGPMGSYSHRVMHFLENDISARLEMEVANGVVLSSDTRLHAGDLSALRIYFPTTGHQWAVRLYVF